MAQKKPIHQPKFALGDMVILGGAIVRVIGYERFYPMNDWFYLLGAKVGSKKVTWHFRTPEWELEAPCWDNVVDLTGRI